MSTKHWWLSGSRLSEPWEVFSFKQRYTYLPRYPSRIRRSNSTCVRFLPLIFTPGYPSVALLQPGNSKMPGFLEGHMPFQPSCMPMTTVFSQTTPSADQWPLSPSRKPHPLCPRPRAGRLPGKTRTNREPLGVKKHNSPRSINVSS